MLAATTPLRYTSGGMKRITTTARNGRYKRGNEGNYVETMAFRSYLGCDGFQAEQHASYALRGLTGG
jgi:hypothetical protein